MNKLEMGSNEINPNTFLKHEGVISRITTEGIVVSLKGNINCEGCKAQSACGVSESNDKEITILSSDNSFKLSNCLNFLFYSIKHESNHS